MSRFAIGEMLFEREHDGSVRVRVNDPRARGVVYPPETWARIVAAMSLRGESSAVIDEARALHAKPQP